MDPRIERAVDYIGSKIPFTPKLGLILGSGLGDYAENGEDAIVLPYEKIPDFPVSTVSGHAGQFVTCYCMGYPCILMRGRFHYYEGYSLQDVTIPVRVMKKLGVETLIITNAAGGINESFHPGDLMLITDHINLCGNNPLIGRNQDEFGPRFPDMSAAYNEELREIIKKSALYESIDLKEGVYAMMTGPSYETPAEIRMLRALGADAVGMSTVPEVIVAVQCGIKVAGISCITNMAAGILNQPLNHLEVMQTAEKVKETFKRCLNRVILNLK